MSAAWTLTTPFVLRHAGFPFDWLESLGMGADVLMAADGALDVENSGSAKARDEAMHRFEMVYASELRLLRERLRELAGHEQVQEAVFLSSPDMYENVWRSYVTAESVPDNSRWRRVERQVYSYMQRLCAKNETTSFFGPMGYGDTAGADGAPFEVVVDAAPGRRRRTFYSVYAIRKLCAAISGETGLRNDLPIRRNPMFLFGREFARCEALGVEIPLDSEARRLLDAIGERSTLIEAARECAVSVEGVVQKLRPLLKATALMIGIAVPTEDFDLFEAVRIELESFPESMARSLWLARWTELEALRREFEQAPLETRRQLLPKMEALFFAWTGQPARRGEGQHYADRFIIYEEAGSPFSIRVSETLWAELGRRLGPALELSAAYGEQVQKCYRDEMTSMIPEEGVDFLTYATRLRSGHAPTGSRFSPVPPVTIDSDDIGEVDLDPTRCGRASAGARYALPDLCLAAPSPAAIATGNFDLLLARVHHHLLLWCWLCAFHDEPKRFDGPVRNFLCDDPSLTALVTSRRNKGFYRFPGRRIHHTVSDAPPPGISCLLPRSLRVRRSKAGPELVTATGEVVRLYLPLDDFSHYPPFAALAHPLVLHAPVRTTREDSPRIRIGSVIYQRQRWELDLTPFVSLKGPHLWLELHRQRRNRGWPRFVFCRTVQERKPFLIDTRCPFAVEILRHLARSSTKATLEEMLPAPDDLWLTDERGRYTCELRVQAHRRSETIE